MFTRKSPVFWAFIVSLIITPALACQLTATATPISTPTPSQSHQSQQNLSSGATPVPGFIDFPTPTALAPTDTPVPPPTETPVPTDPPPPPTDTPEPAPTNPPPPPPTDPPPPPADTPVPAPTEPPAPPPPTQPPANSGPVVNISFPDGNIVETGDKVKFVVIVTDPDGVAALTWGVFTQNQVGLAGDDKDCNDAPECKVEQELQGSPLEGTFIVGVDAADTKGEVTRGVAEFYVEPK